MPDPAPTAPPACGATPQGVPVPRRYWIVSAVALAIAMSVLDGTMVNVALPSMARDLSVSSAASIWIVNSYQLAVLMVLLPLAALGEIAGFRRVFALGLAVFVLASLACAVAPGLLTLSAARFVQGLGAAAMYGTTAALLRLSYPANQLGRALALSALVVACCAAAGPTLASLILAVAHWRWLFGVNVPLGIAALLIAARVLPDSERAARSLSLTAVALYAGTFGLLLAGLQNLAHQSGGSVTAALLVGACVLGALLVQRELPQHSPLVPFDLLRNRTFTLSVVTSICAFAAQACALVALPFEIQRLGHSAVQTGLYLTPWPLALALAAPLAGRLADRYPAGILCTTGLALLAGALALLAQVPSAGGSLALAWRMSLCGLGFGLFQGPNNRALISAAPRRRSGAAAGMLSAARLLGQTLGAAGVAILFGASGAGGSRLALHLAAALAGAAALVSLTRLRSD